MGPSGLVCPLCCGEEFPCRASLRQHIVEASHNLRCPACQRAVPSLSELVQHLDTEQCSDLSRMTDEVNEAPALEQADEMAHIPMALVDDKHELKSLLKIESTQVQGRPNQLASTTEELNSLNTIEGSESHLLIVGGESTSLLANQNIITTQNEDGTISFTPVEPEELECAEEERLSPGEEELEGEVYSCNTCGVSFTSVLQHIQRYHSEQDVVVEVAGAEGEAPEEVQVAVGGGKRVITSTGDIVETHTHVNSQREGEVPSYVMEEEVVDKSGRAYTRRLVKIDKFWNDDQSVVVTSSKVKETLEFDAEEGHSVRIFSCRRCNMKSSEIEDLRSHNCKPAGVYQCSQCPVTYTNPKSLCAHMKVHKIGTTKLTAQLDVFETKTETELMSFKCLVCDTVFPSNKSLRLHRRMHEPVKSRPMEGPVEYSSVEQGTGEGDSGDTYHCEVCDKWIHVGYREIHNNYHHSSVQYHCEICNRKFLSQDYLMMHMNVHSTEKTSVAKSDKVLPYSCLYCKRQFARPHEKVKHERIHTGEKPHTCEICGKAFRVSYCLTLHMRTHTGARPYECQHCGKRFKAHSVYNHHLLTHSEVRAYKCPYCPKAFKTSVQLAGHKNSHTKPFACTHCNRPFASLYAVRVHTETHRRQNNLKFSCKLCGASYARAFALKDHVKSAHDTVPDSVEYNSPEAAYEADPALAIMPKKEDNFEVEELAHSSIESEIAMM